MLSREKLLHPATLIAMLALFVALSGVGYAATQIGTSQIKNSAVTTPKIKTGAVTNGKIKANAVTTGKIATGGVTSSDIAGGAVGTKGLANGAVNASKIAAGAVGSNALANGGVVGGKLGNGAVTNEKLGPNSVTSAKIAGSTITAANIAPGQVVTGKGSLVSARSLLGPAVTAATPVLTVPGIATLSFDCAVTTGAATTVTNISGAPLTVSAAALNDGAAPVAQSQVLAAGASASLANTGTGGVQGTTWQLGAGEAATARVATVTVSVAGAATPGTGCAVTAQALTTG